MGSVICCCCRDQDKSKKSLRGQTIQIVSAHNQNESTNVGKVNEAFVATDSDEEEEVYNTAIEMEVAPRVKETAPQPTPAPRESLQSRSSSNVEESGTNSSEISGMSLQRDALRTSHSRKPLPPLPKANSMPVTLGNMTKAEGGPVPMVRRSVSNIERTVFYEDPEDPYEPDPAITSDAKVMPNVLENEEGYLDPVTVRGKLHPVLESPEEVEPFEPGDLAKSFADEMMQFISLSTVKDSSSETEQEVDDDDDLETELDTDHEEKKASSSTETIMVEDQVDSGSTIKYLSKPSHKPPQPPTTAPSMPEQSSDYETNSDESSGSSSEFEPTEPTIEIVGLASDHNEHEVLELELAQADEAEAEVESYQSEAESPRAPTPGTLKCSMCDWTTLELEELWRHLTQAHPRGGISNTVSTSDNSTGPSVFQCAEKGCGFVTKKELKLLQHVVDFHSLYSAV